MVADSFVFDLELIFRGAVRLAARFEYIYIFSAGVFFGLTRGKDNVNICIILLLYWILRCLYIEW